jgi:hypothetical protein
MNAAQEHGFDAHEWLHKAANPWNVLKARSNSERE